MNIQTTKASEEINQKFLSITDAAKYIKKSRHTIRNWIKNGKNLDYLPVIFVLNRPMIRISDLDRFMLE